MGDLVTGSARHHHHHQQSRLGQFLRRFGFEIVWLIVIALGILLVMERMSIRTTVTRWMQAGMASYLHSVGHVDEALLAIMTRTTLADMIGLLLIVGALVATLFRVRWRLLRTPALTVIKCPRCGSRLHRVHRRLGDRLVSWFVPVRRYRCASRECRWSGLRVAAGEHWEEPATNIVQS